LAPDPGNNRLGPRRQSRRSRPTLKTIQTRNSYEEFALTQKKDVDICSAWAKLGRVETKRRHSVTRKSRCLRVRQVAADLPTLAFGLSCFCYPTGLLVIRPMPLPLLPTAL
jgi:hypothetical protein